MKKELLHQFFEGTTTPEEEQEIKKWTDASTEHAEELFREHRLYDASILLTSPEVEKHKELNPNRSILREILKIAAIAILTLSLGHAYQIYKVSQFPVEMQTISVPAGQYINLNLPDGTQVWLNARTTLKYPVNFNKKHRTVELDGEAYFEVAPNKKKPFLVKTDKYHVEVLGTKFNIEAYKDKNTFATTLMEGKVRINSANCTKDFLILKPDTKAVYEDGNLAVHYVDDYNPYRWREGLICFKNISFSQIMEDFEKYYGVKIHILNEQVNKYNYTGKFRQTDGIDYALRVLQKDIVFSYNRNDEKQEIIIE